MSLIASNRISKLLQQCIKNNNIDIKSNNISNNLHHHSSWNHPETDANISILDTLQILQRDTAKCDFVTFYQNGSIPVYDVSQMTSFDLINNNKSIQSKIYNEFYNGCGAIIVRGGYEPHIMSEYNKWCTDFLEIAKKDGNCRHPKQPGKYLINDIVLRLGKDNPNLLMKMINNKYFTLFTDILLGFMKFGSCTAHWIEAGGDRQLSHVDYPMHVGSGPFWENNINKLKQLTTKYQINHILPYYSVQVLIASDAMSIKNGSTEVVPYSHRIPNIDVLIHNNNVYKQFEKYFINVELNQGDFLIFNRRLCHRGGKNISNKRRNSLIVQCVWLWGVGQEIIEYDKVLNCLKNSKDFNELNDKQKEEFLLRLKHHYPADIKKST